MVFYVVALHKEGLSEQQIEQVAKNEVLGVGTRQALGNLISLQTTAKLNFKVGSIDQLMELMDSFQKLDLAVDGACKKNEKIYQDMCKELKQSPELQIEQAKIVNGKREVTKLSILQYIQNFVWDSGRYQLDKSMGTIAAKIQNTQKTCDDRLKNVVDLQNSLKNQCTQFQKKRDAKSYMTKDLADVVYDEPPVKKDVFVNVHGCDYLTTILVVVPKPKLNQFSDFYMTALLNQKKKDYEARKDFWMESTRISIAKSDEVEEMTQKFCDEKGIDPQDEAAMNEISVELEKNLASLKKKLLEKAIAEKNIENEQPGVVPDSAKYLNKSDNDGNQLWRVTCVKSDAIDYMRILKRNGYPCQDFTYDAEKHIKERQNIVQIEEELKGQNMKVHKNAENNFAELFQGLMHLKIMRCYIDGILRFGVPVRFYMGIIKPEGVRNDAKILQKLEQSFAEDHLKEMYGAKQDANDEDFFPYVSIPLTSPASLM